MTHKKVKTGAGITIKAIKKIKTAPIQTLTKAREKEIVKKEKHHNEVDEVKVNDRGKNVTGDTE